MIELRNIINLILNGSYSVHIKLESMSKVWYFNNSSDTYLHGYVVGNTSLLKTYKTYWKTEPILMYNNFLILNTGLLIITDILKNRTNSDFLLCKISYFCRILLLLVPILDPSRVCRLCSYGSIQYCYYKATSARLKIM